MRLAPSSARRGEALLLKLSLNVQDVTRVHARQYYGGISPPVTYNEQLASSLPSCGGRFAWALFARAVHAACGLRPCMRPGWSTRTERESLPSMSYDNCVSTRPSCVIINISPKVGRFCVLRSFERTTGPKRRDERRRTDMGVRHHAV